MFLNNKIFLRLKFLVPARNAAWPCPGQHTGIKLIEFFQCINLYFRTARIHDTLCKKQGDEYMILYVRSRVVIQKLDE